AFTDKLYKFLEPEPGKSAFDSAQKLAETLATTLGLSPSAIAAKYESATKELSFHVKLSDSFAPATLPVALRLQLGSLPGFRPRLRRPGRYRQGRPQRHETHPRHQGRLHPTRPHRLHHLRRPRPDPARPRRQPVRHRYARQTLLHQGCLRHRRGETVRDRRQR